MKHWRIFLLAAALVFITGFSLRQQPVSAQSTDGVVRRTTAEIMEADANAPRLTGIRIKREKSNEARRFLLPDPTEIRGLDRVISPRLSQTPDLEFSGSTLAEANALNGFNIFPPDTMGAVGPSQYLVGINGRIRVFDKTTGAEGALDASIDEFFAGVTSTDGYTSDPRVRYDRFTQKWILIIIDVAQTVENRVLLAVSDSDTITAGTVWEFFYFDIELAEPAGNADCFFDYPTLGVDVNALYIGGPLFCDGGVSYGGSTAFVVRKAFIDDAATSNLVAPTAFVKAFRNISSGSSGIYVPQGVDNYDPAATQGYFIGVDEGVFGRLVMHVVSDPGSTNPTISAATNIAISATSYPVPVPHPGSTSGNGRLDSIDDRLYAAVMRNGRLWTAHNIGVDTTGAASSAAGVRNAVRWYELSVSGASASVQQSGIIYDNAASNPVHYWFPAIMVSGQGHAVMGFSAAGNTTAVGAAVTGRLSGDAANAMAAPTIYEAGFGDYSPSGDPGSSWGRRWGDYSYTSLDPCDDMTLWTIQQYNNATDDYAVRVLELKAPPPAVVPESLGAVSLGLASHTLVINGNSPNGEGFYDTDAAYTDATCRERLEVSINNGVTVNSITYISPLTIEVDISTSAATPGAALVTITNPDGQSVSSSLTVGDDLLVNGNFQTNVDGNLAQPDNWVAKRSTKDRLVCNAITTVCEYLFIGSLTENSMLIQGVSDAGKISQVVAGTTLDTSVYFRTNAIKPNLQVRLMVYYDSGTPLRAKVVKAITRIHNTTPMRLFKLATYTVDSGRTVTKVRLDFINRGTSGRIYIDNASVIYTPAAPRGFDIPLP